MKQISSGAEAIIYSDGDNIIKDRIEKLYRIKEIDDSLRNQRTKREAKVLQRLSEANFSSPLLKDSDKTILRMQHISGDTLRNTIYKDPLGLGREIGSKLGIMHSYDVIHGDLTTSNMILDKEVNFIDFGLSFFSKKIEDRAVDLHVLRQALESKHHEVWETAFKAALEGYKETNSQAPEVLKRLEKVELRGRNKH